MTRINLLPWREELRKERKQRFIAMLAAGGLLGIGIWAAGHQYYSSEIAYQERRNNILQTEIRRLDRQIAEIRDLESTKANLISRMNVIQELQQGRPQVVHLFHQIATTVPDGLYLTSLKQTGRQLTITGRAESNARVSSYMENLDASEWLRNPRLDVIQVREHERRRISEYTLRVEQVNAIASASTTAADSNVRTTSSTRNQRGNR